MREDGGVEVRTEQEQREWLRAEEARVAHRLVVELKAELEGVYGRLDDTLDEVVRLRGKETAGRARDLLNVLARRPGGHDEQRAAEEPPPSFAEVRRRVAVKFLRRDGIEIGALNEPLWLPDGVRVRYVDRMSLEQLRDQYPELHEKPVVAPDIVDDGETLGSFADASLDFIVANHFIEHCQDPIGTIGQHLRVLRDGGILYLAVPDKRRTFDIGRPLTTLEHLVLDHREGPARSRWDHYLEWAIATEGQGGARALQLAEQDYSVHCHIWTPDTFLAFLSHCRTEIGLPFELAAYEPNDFEFVVVLRRTRRL